MFKITIQNTQTGKKFSASFATQAQCTEWHNKKKHIHGDEASSPPTATVSIIDVSSQEIMKLKNTMLGNYTQTEQSNLGTTAAVNMINWASMGNTKAIANMNWVSALWVEYKNKCDQMDAGVTVSMTPSNPWKPYPYNVVKDEMQQH